MMGYPPLLGMVVPNLLERLIKIAGPITDVAIIILGSIAGVFALGAFGLWQWRHKGER